MSTIAIVQARMGSTRLPGKVLMTLNNQTVLSHVLRRCQLVPGVDEVCCAISDSEDSDPLVYEAQKCGVQVYRGSNGDVLKRYAGAAAQTNATTILRVTSDCPLIDPGVCGEVLALVKNHGFDFACNNQPPSFPYGLDCEAFSVDLLNKANTLAIAPNQREHVSPWMRQAPKFKKGNYTAPSGNFQNQRWTIDYREDFEFLQAVFKNFPDQTFPPSWQEVFYLVENNSALKAINLMHTRPQ